LATSSDLFQSADQQLDITKTKDLAQKLKDRIFGQDHIVETVADMIDISAAGLGNPDKPIASFLFTGPTGVGKTEFAKELAKIMNIHFERFDMSEYADEYSARNLTGGQMGLVGYEDGGLLTNRLDNILEFDRPTQEVIAYVIDKYLDDFSRDANGKSICELFS
jgi:ATP-dependent Clp protease ATP-binding subunit ClpA